MKNPVTASLDIATEFPPRTAPSTGLQKNPAQDGLALRSASLNANSRTIWIMIAGLLVITAVAWAAAGLSLSWTSISTLAECMLILMATSFCYRKLRPDAHIAFCTEGLAQVSLVLWVGCVLSYPVATIGMPYRDSMLHAADAWIGLDWRAYLHFLNRHRTLGTASALAYRSVSPQLLGLFVALAATSKFQRMQQYILATAVALAVTLAVFAFVPAGGTFAFLEIGPQEYANLAPVTTTHQLVSLDALRSGKIVEIADMEGLITFPSFHTAWAILFMWGFYPVKKLRLAAIALNLLMIASTPVMGAHYFVDLLGGIIVALAAIAAAVRLFPKSHEACA